MATSQRSRIQNKITQLIENSTDVAEVEKLTELFKSLKPPSKQPKAPKPKLDPKLQDILGNSKNVQSGV